MRTRLLTVIILGLVVSYLLLRSTDSTQTDQDSSRATLQQAEYDYYMSAIDNTVFQADGSRSYRLQAGRLTHFPANDLAVLDKPLFHVYERGAETAWEITALSARIANNSRDFEQRVELIDDVVIHRLDDSGRPMNIYTDFLTVYPASRLLVTDRGVLITLPGAEVTATGMEGDLNNRHITLLADVRGRYE